MRLSQSDIIIISLFAKDPRPIARLQVQHLQLQEARAPGNEARLVPQHPILSGCIR